MTAPFDQIAPAYARLWSETPHGRAQRQQVWRQFDGVFRAGDRVLDLGCGTCDDALHLAARGVEVVGIDASQKMVELGRARGADARLLPIEQLARLPGPFSGAISNFGALNCVRDLRRVARELARLLNPEARAALCVMGRFRWREPRRWWGRAHWRGIPVYYRSAREISRDFAPEFRLRRRVSIGGGDHLFLLFERR